MAQAPTRVVATKRIETETIVDFPYERLKAPFVLRCAAFCVDYMILLALPILWFVLSGFLSDSGTMTIGPAIWFIGVLLFLADFIVLPLFRGQSIGKMLLGLTILKTDGSRLHTGDLVKRNILGYLVTAITLGVGFLISGLNASGRSLHDFIGGTVVVRARKAQI